MRYWKGILSRTSVCVKNTENSSPVEITEGHCEPCLGAFPASWVVKLSPARHNGSLFFRSRSEVNHLTWLAVGEATSTPFVSEYGEYHSEEKISRIAPAPRCFYQVFFFLQTCKLILLTSCGIILSFQNSTVTTHQWQPMCLACSRPKHPKKLDSYKALLMAFWHMDLSQIQKTQYARIFVVGIGEMRYLSKPLLLGVAYQILTRCVYTDTGMLMSETCKGAWEYGNRGELGQCLKTSAGCQSCPMQSSLSGTTQIHLWPNLFQKTYQLPHHHSL